MAEPEIRPARREDCAAMASIYNHYVERDTCTFRTDPEALEERQAWFDQHGADHPVFVAEAEGRVIGWASLNRWNSRCGYRMTVEDSIYLDPTWRGRGLGARLLARLVEAAVARGHHRVIAAISADQSRSVSLHQRFGFVEVGRMTEVGHKFGRWLDVVYLQLSVPAEHLGAAAPIARDESVPVTLAIEDPRQPEVIALIRALDDHCAALYPKESNHFLGADRLAQPDIRFIVARQGGRAVGCGALRIDTEGYGEVKRMFVAPSVRGSGLGRRILERVEAEARAAQLPTLRLETGIRQPEALGLYRAAGYVPCAPFGGYETDPLSVFMEKHLVGAVAHASRVAEERTKPG